MAKKLMYLAVVSLLLGVMGQNVVWAARGANHKAFQERPIKLGTSGGNIEDRSSDYCCSGTLGALVEDGAGVYILGNNHVLARSNAAAIGEAINQPGQIDQNCDQDGPVANLSDYVEILFGTGSINIVDAAIAKIRVDCTDNDGNTVDCVDTSGSILGIGQISSNTVLAVLDKAVKKSGRTTGLTSGNISAVDVSVNVSYSDECGGSTTGMVARFVNQFFVRPGKFSRGGDSSSLIVEADDVDPNDGLPRAVGLLFAGSNLYTVANPIDVVLSQLGVTMVGGTAPDPDPDPDPNDPGTEPGVGTISGTVTVAGNDNDDDNPIPIVGAKIRVDSGQSGKTDAYGNYTITGVPVGVHSAKASAKGFGSQTEPGIVVKAVTEGVDFELSARVKGRKGAIEIARNVKARHGKKLFDIPGVVGHGIGLSKKGRPVIHVYLEDDLPQARARIPAKLDGVSVQVLVTGSFKAF